MRAPLRDGGAGARDAHRLRERGDVVRAVVAPAIDEERGRAGDVAEIRAVDVFGDATGTGVLLEIGGETVDVEAELARLVDEVGGGGGPLAVQEEGVPLPEHPLGTPRLPRPRRR